MCVICKRKSIGEKIVSLKKQNKQEAGETRENYDRCRLRI